MNYQIAKWARFLNIIDLLGICFILLLAFVLQIALNELPCPLCLLQRVGILGIGFGFLLNIHYQIKARHYAFSLLASIFTGFVAMRQIVLHIIPGTGSYGAPFLGLHLYTWDFILAIACILYTTFMLCISGQYGEGYIVKKSPKWMKSLGHFAFLCFLAVLLLNVISTFLECGIKACPDNPIMYHITLWKVI